MEYLKKEDFTLINRMTIEAHGGNFVPPSNFLHEDALDYLVDAVKAEMFGEPLYPKLHQKVGLYMFNIITSHVFQDGNKRTGLEAALLFLRLNNYQLISQLKKVVGENEISVPEKGESTNEILYHFTMDMASGKLTLEDSQNWFKENIQEDPKQFANF